MAAQVAARPVGARKKAQEKQLQLSLVFAQAMKLIETDDRRLKQILVKLLGNAVKFTPGHDAYVCKPLGPQQLHALLAQGLPSWQRNFI